MRREFVKRITALSICLCAAVTVCGCEDKASEIIQAEETAVIEAAEEDLTPDTGGDTSDPPADETPQLSATDGVDVDLTILSSTAVYGEVFTMMYDPDQYVGKVVRMKGDYSDFLDEKTGKHYFACMIKDATACCAQGIEFILSDDYSYPDDYPEDGDCITVEGIFDTYKEDSMTYCTLKDATLLDSGA